MGRVGLHTAPLESQLIQQRSIALRPDPAHPARAIPREVNGGRWGADSLLDLDAIILANLLLSR